MPVKPTPPAQSLENLRAPVLRLRAAEAARDAAQRQLAACELEYTAARQELDDAIILELKAGGQ